MKRFIPVFALSFSLLLSCAQSQEIRNASRVIDSYYQTLKENRAANASQYFSPDFQAKNPPELWIATASEIIAEMGPIVRWERLSEKSHYYTKTRESQEIVVLIYTTHYEKHYSRELFTLAKDPDTGEYRICGMDITEKGIKKEKKK
jgi:hypothetical protein